MNNKYAMITGASQGLGKFLAMECASRGMNLVLVALPGTRLVNLSRLLSYRYNVEVFTVELDLSVEKNCYYLHDLVKANNIAINILINNAGIGGNFSFEQKDPEFYSHLISLNIITPTLLCKLFLDDLKENGPSYIMNVSSLAAIFHLPQKQVYGGTKSYLLAFSNSLRSELKREGISVSALCPGGMNTYWRILMENRTKGTWISRQSIMEPSEVAAIAIRKMLQKKPLIIPGMINHFFLLLNKMIPEPVKNYLLQVQMARTSRFANAG
jgi:uncharacterized protein